MTPETKKIAIYAGFAITLVGGYFLFFNGSEKGTGGVDPTGNGSNSNPGNLNTFNAKNIADDLLEAMREMGTNTLGIVDILTNVNESQFAQVIKAFSKPQYNSTLGNQYNFNPFSQLPFTALKEWLKNELSASDYRILKLKYPNYL